MVDAVAVTSIERTLSDLAAAGEPSMVRRFTDLRPRQRLPLRRDRCPSSPMGGANPPMRDHSACICPCGLRPGKAITAWLNAGVPLETAQAWSGHKTVSVLLDTYLGVMRGDEDLALTRFEAASTALKTARAPASRARS